MTTSKAEEASRRKPRAERPRTPYGDLAIVCERVAAEHATDGTGYLTAAERAHYREHPDAYATDVLGVRPWAKQIEILFAVRDHKRVAVRSGHKVSKSHTAGILALWFYDCFDDARVVLTAVTSRQVDKILWREIRKLIARAKRPIRGEVHELARSGITSEDFREIVGFTAREAEAVAGVSGRNLLYLVDEASGVPDAIFEAIEGNRAGGARVGLFSNPTRTEGEFFEAFDTKTEFYKTFTISSEESPNVVAGREVIPGLAERAWIEEKKREWGEDSPLFKIRVKGVHVLAEEGKILSVHAIQQAEILWDDTPAIGRLHLGLDPSGPGLAGDETAFAARRGQKILGLVAMRGLSEGAILAHALGILTEHRKPGDEVPLVKIDREGPIGTDVLAAFRAHAAARPQDFEVVAVRSSDKAFREPHLYDRVRDELWANLARWIRAGGAIVEDTKLAKELHSPEWEGQLSGKLKATPKDVLKKRLGRSPDRADAVALAVWDLAAWQEEAPGPPKPPRASKSSEATDAEITPYARPINPYAGVGWGENEDL
jgi:hypothetical protein